MEVRVAPAQRTARSPSRTGADRDLGTSAAIVRSAKAEIARIVRGGNSIKLFGAKQTVVRLSNQISIPSGASLPHVEIVFVVLSNCLLFNIREWINGNRHPR